MSLLFTALRLGRVSNLPTVWTNVLAGTALAGTTPHARDLWPLAGAMSLLYVGGMYLNDAFDQAWDRVQRPERPIPSGAISARAVFAAGFALLFAGVLWVALLSIGRQAPGFRPAWSALALAGLIVLYDFRHKQVPLSPVVMGLCRVGVYLTAGLFVERAAPRLWFGAGAMLCHVIGLSYIAKHETAPRLARLWPLLVLLVPVGYSGFVVSAAADGPALRAAAGLFVAYVLAGGVSFHWVPGFGTRPNPGLAIPLLIANISLLDGVFVAAAGSPAAGLACTLAWLLAVWLQRKVPGT